MPDIGVKEAELLAEHQQREQYVAELQAEEDALKLKQSTCEHDYQQRGFIQFCVKCDKPRPMNG